MKAESAQRQHLQELRNSTKDKPSSKLVTTDCPSPTRRLTARKSINPLKQGHTSAATFYLPEDKHVDGSEGAPLVGADQRLGPAMEDSLQPKEATHTDAETLKNPAQEAEAENAGELQAQERIQSSSFAEGVEATRGDAPPASPEESSIDKVWETIQRDLNSVGSVMAGEEEEGDDLDSSDSKEEGEVDALEEMFLEPQGIPIEEPEEEPSDWEDREPNLEDDDDDDDKYTKAEESSPKQNKMVRECVLISSDDEAGADHPKTVPGGITENDGDDEDYRLELDTSSEISEAPSHKRDKGFLEEVSEKEELPQVDISMTVPEQEKEQSEDMEVSTEQVERAEDHVEEEEHIEEMEEIIEEVEEFVEEEVEEYLEEEVEEYIDEEEHIEDEEEKDGKQTQGVEKQVEEVEKHVEKVEDIVKDTKEHVEETEKHVEEAEELVEEVEEHVEGEEEDHVEEVEEHVEEVEEHVEEVEEHVEEVEERVEDVDENVEDVEEHVEDEEHVDEVEEHVEEVEEHVEEEEEHVEEVEEQAVKIQEHIEEVEEQAEKMQEQTVTMEEQVEKVEEQDEKMEEQDEKMEEQDKMEEPDEKMEEQEEKMEEQEEKMEEQEEDMEDLEQGMQQQVKEVKKKEEPRNDDDEDQQQAEKDSVPMEVSLSNTVEKGTVESGKGGDKISAQEEQTHFDPVEVEDTAVIKRPVQEDVSDSQVFDTPAEERDYVPDQSGDRDQDEVVHVECKERDADSTNAGAANVEPMLLDAEDKVAVVNAIIQESPSDHPNMNSKVQDDKEHITVLMASSAGESDQQKPKEKSSESADLSNAQPEPQECKVVTDPSSLSVTDVICLGTDFSKDAKEESKKGTVNDRHSDDKDIRGKLQDGLAEQSRTIEDDDLEVLEVKDVDRVSKELSGAEEISDSQKKDIPVSSETKSDCNKNVKDDSDREVEMIDLEVVDSGPESGGNEDVKHKAGESAGKDVARVTVSSAEPANKSVVVNSSSSKEKDVPVSDASSMQSKCDNTPEIVVLDLENDSEADCKDEEKKTLKEKDMAIDSSDITKDKSEFPVEVDLDSESTTDVSASEKALKQTELCENDSNSFVRKRHLSQQSQNHVNITEQSKRPKLDLSEEPMEDALKQLDILRMKEKKENCIPTKVKLTKEVLEELINRRLHEHINNSQKSIIEELRSRCDGLEKAVDRWKKKAQALQNSINDLNTELQKHQRKPRGPTRTVGINVRISTNEPLRPLNSKILPAAPKPPDPIPVKATATLVTTSQVGPIPMHLVPNLAASPSKTLVAPPTPSPSTPQKQTVQNTTLAGGATVKIIDLTHEDDEAALKNVRQPQPQQPQVQAVPVQQSPVVPPNVVLSNSLTRTSGPITLQTNAGGPLMQVPVTMQIIPSASTAGGSVTLRGPRPTMSLPGNMAPPGSRVTTYLVPSGLPAMGSPRQIVPISGSPGVMQSTGVRPAAPMQTFLLRMNTVPTPVSSTFTTLTTGSSVASFNRGPPNVTLTSRSMLTPAAASGVGQPTLLTTPRNVTPTMRASNPANTVVIPIVQKHPAPFPQQLTYNPNPQFKGLPPKPALKISKVDNGIVLSWNLTLNSTHAEIAKYQLYAYQEGNGPPLPSLWKKVGDVKALPLPMACTLTQFMEGNKYHFAICAVDKHNRCGPFSDPSSILLSDKELHR